MARLFQQISGEYQESQMMMGTTAEAFVPSEILTLSGGYLTKAAVDSDGTQQYICLNTATGDQSTYNVMVHQIRTTDKYRVHSSATVAVTLIGAVVTLTAACTGITATETKGVFQIDSTDGGATNSDVVGHFTNTLSDVI